MMQKTLSSCNPLLLKTPSIRKKRRQSLLRLISLSTIFRHFTKTHQTYFFLIIKRSLTRYWIKTSNKKLTLIMTHFERELKKLSDSTKSSTTRMNFRMKLKRDLSLKLSKIFDVNLMRSIRCDKNKRQNLNLSQSFLELIL